MDASEILLRTLEETGNTRGVFFSAGPTPNWTRYCRQQSGSCFLWELFTRWHNGLLKCPTVLPCDSDTYRRGDEKYQGISTPGWRLMNDELGNLGQHQQATCLSAVSGGHQDAVDQHRQPGRTGTQLGQVTIHRTGSPKKNHL